MIGGGLAAMAAIGVFTGRRRRWVPARGWRSKRLHERKQGSAERALETLRTIDPALNPARAIGYLRKVDPLVFEEMILTELEERGHTIRRGARYSGDGGVDGTFWMDGALWLIQAKRYGAAINRAHVEAFGAVCSARGAKGLFVHTGRTGGLARTAEAENPHIRIVSGRDLVTLFSGGRVQIGRPTSQGVVA
jgi:restriction system protein